MRFTAIDFETANSRPDSACAIGIAVFEDGAPVDTFYSCICPPDRYFSPFCTRIHGMTMADVKDSGDFAALWPSIERYFSGGTIFAHYARFDMGVLHAALSRFNLQPPDFHYGCTCEVSRRFFPGLPNHRLDTVCSHLGISFNHHHALSDALACGTILSYVLKKAGCPSLDRLFADNRLKLKPAGTYNSAPEQRIVTGRSLEL